MVEYKYIIKIISTFNINISRLVDSLNSLLFIGLFYFLFY